VLCRDRVCGLAFAGGRWQHVLHIAWTGSLSFKESRAAAILAPIVKPVYVCCSNVGSVAPVWATSTPRGLEAAMVGRESIHGGGLLWSSVARKLGDYVVRGALNPRPPRVLRSQVRAWSLEDGSRSQRAPPMNEPGPCQIDNKPGAPNSVPFEPLSTCRSYPH
jgi:hypothetical protein